MEILPQLTPLHSPVYRKREWEVADNVITFPVNGQIQQNGIGYAVGKLLKLLKSSTNNKVISANR